MFDVGTLLCCQDGAAGRMQDADDSVVLEVQPACADCLPEPFYLFPPTALFDEAFYLMHNPDVAAVGMDLWQHYCEYGWQEGRDPSAHFSTRYYIDNNRDVAAAGHNPLLHYATHGWREGRDPSTSFSVATYLHDHPNVAAAGYDPLLHYMKHGHAEGVPSAPPHTWP